MKLLFFLFTLAFMVAMFIRIVEMSVAFDWVDVGWTFIFMVCALFTGCAFSASKTKMGDEW